MVPETFRIINRRDIVPNHPFCTGFVGVGRRIMIDINGGGNNFDTALALISRYPRRVWGFFSGDSAQQHLTVAYLESFTKAIDNQLNPKATHVF